MHADLINDIWIFGSRAGYYDFICTVQCKICISTTKYIINREYYIQKSIPDAISLPVSQYKPSGVQWFGWYWATSPDIQRPEGWYGIQYGFCNIFFYLSLTYILYKVHMDTCSISFITTKFHKILWAVLEELCWHVYVILVKSLSSKGT